MKQFPSSSAALLPSIIGHSLTYTLPLSLSIYLPCACLPWLAVTVACICLHSIVTLLPWYALPCRYCEYIARSLARL